ncbi:endonuclease/exonuclease/phosphatase family protein, partial [Kibdelosporangium lantanae]
MAVPSTRRTARTNNALNLVTSSAMRQLLTILATVVITSTGLPAHAADTGSGTFSVLSYNIAGLPEGISSAPTPRAPSTTAIGQRIGGYDVVHVQEDFNYHANLYAADSHPFRTPTSGGAGIGSGLNTLSSLPYDTDDFERVHWDSCQFDSGDCLTPKGFTFSRLRLAEGVYVDLYNLHTNAGTSTGDLSSRAANLNQLTEFIATHSAGNAVVVMGDTNTRYTRTGDTIRDFASRNGLTDAWVRLERGGVPPAAGSDPVICPESSCEIVDKILFRGNRLVTLTATSYDNEHAKFLDANGAMLSDHDPITVRFAWSRTADLQLSDQFGGPHGAYFTDIDRVTAPPTVLS